MITTPLKRRWLAGADPGWAHRVLHHTEWLACSGRPVDVERRGAGPLGLVPGLRKMKVLGLLLRAQHAAGRPMRSWFSPPLWPTLTYEQAAEQHRLTPFDGLVLPGACQGMRPYLESTVLQALVASFFDARDEHGQHRPVAAVCHGVLLAARARSVLTGRSVLHGRRTTALTWRLEKSAWDLTRWWARFWDPSTTELMPKGGRTIRLLERRG